ncbi:zinc metallochaperone AztD [Glutamicibacter sp. MNS18]|uniref:zinc metallochaperone AztD n=1 Tax=Glutamicibacter sp. MNS18 TaxID=2989817 RepID=UPI002236715B|nr:zinc metallochaperone AztD [Glutamicibacter sp. MNS18]MCW4465626.1 zinc metallochaperone AztD [Glutamicibacter sp. MNS18]
MKKLQNRPLALFSTLALLGLAATGCASGSTGSAPEPAASGQGVEHGLAPLAVSYENGIAVLDGTSLDVLATLDSEEFTRLNAVGDGKHILVTTSRGFEVLDTAVPELTGATFSATTPGHVVRHAGKTVLFDDGTGDTTVFETSALDAAGRQLPETRVIPGQEAHHGVSVELADGTLVTTIGTEQSRSGAKALDSQGQELDSNTSCPGIHGEETAQGEAVVFGCEDGALLYHDGHFDKFTAPDDYGRMGNAYVSENSPIIVGDYKNDPDAEGYLLNRMALIDTAKHSYEVIELPAGVQYTWRGVVRGPDEQAYILATDGAIHVLDPSTGEITGKYDVLDPWQGPMNWQDPHPAMTLNGSIAYVADPENNQVHAVDLETGDRTATATLDAAPNEMAAALG